MIYTLHAFWIEHDVNYAQSVGKLEVAEVSLKSERPVEAAQGRHFCELLPPLCSHCVAVGDFNATDEASKEPPTRVGSNSANIVVAR